MASNKNNHDTCSDGQKMPQLEKGQEISLKIEDMVAQANSIADNSNIVMDGAKELSQSADNLKEHIGRFKI